MKVGKWYNSDSNLELLDFEVLQSFHDTILAISNEISMQFLSLSFISQ